MGVSMSSYDKEYCQIQVRFNLERDEKLLAYLNRKGSASSYIRQLIIDDMYRKGQDPFPEKEES